MTASVTVTSNVFTLIGLSAGTYAGFSITTAGCTGTDASTKTLVSPANINITTQPQDLFLCQGNNGVFSVQASGTGLSYQWQELISGVYENITNGGIYSGVTTNTLGLTFPAVAKNGSKYRVIVSSGGCEAISSVVTLILTLGAEAIAITNVSPISGEYFQQAVSFVVALNKINSGADVTYQAGNSITLLPGFETRAGSVFRAQIQIPCASSGGNVNTAETYKSLPKEIIK